ncbi:phosphatase PAP2 family protein [Sediminibacterium sp.]|uniref:phosphatase PAP2 family protein n=1 Tax=Sediminibacterium sp. TaxID=1917865 RepID=UPI0025F2B632|nr:phosphatase PAP2 family protein [Sediminibacterium sp.]MBT9483900.1 phosphatase PAP2 family protein [Sediminibacterium sp.]
MNLSAFRTGATLSISTGMILILFSFLGGKEDLFLLLNHDLGSSADFFFKYFTHAGDGIFWVPVALYFIFYKRKLLPLILSSIILSTLLVQTGKKIIYPNEARPTAAIESTLQSPIHTVKGVTVHSNNSFPSGHTTTAFSLFLLGCLLLPYTYFWLIGFTAALLAGYSRIYLAQHFPLDVGAGIICAYITVYLSLQIQKVFNKKWDR